MDKRTIKIGRLATKTPQKFIDLSVSYEKEGPNWFSGGSTGPTGYYLHVIPITDDGSGIISMILGRGSKVLIAPATRYNAKKLMEAAAAAPKHEDYQRAIQRVLSTERLELTPEELAKFTPPSFGTCPSCEKPRPEPLTPGGVLFKPASVCPNCGHVEPQDEVAVAAFSDLGSNPQVRPDLGSVHAD